MHIEDPVLERLELFMDYAARKQRVISSNLANAETPGYKAKQLHFEDIFKAQLEEPGGLKTTKAEHLSGKPVLLREPVVEEKASDTLGYDQNDVDLDKEMTELAQNVLKFSAISQAFQRKIRVIEMSLTEGRN